MYILKGYDVNNRIFHIQREETFGESFLCVFRVLPLSPADKNRSVFLR